MATCNYYKLKQADMDVVDAAVELHGELADFMMEKLSPPLRPLFTKLFGLVAYTPDMDFDVAAVLAVMAQFKELDKKMLTADELDALPSLDD